MKFCSYLAVMAICRYRNMPHSSFPASGHTVRCTSSVLECRKVPMFYCLYYTSVKYFSLSLKFKAALDSRLGSFN